MTVTSDGKGATLAQAPAHAPVGIGPGVSRPAPSGAGPHVGPKDAPLRVLVVTADDPARFRALGGDDPSLPKHELAYPYYGALREAGCRVEVVQARYRNPASLRRAASRLAGFDVAIAWSMEGAMLALAAVPYRANRKVVTIAYANRPPRANRLLAAMRDLVFWSGLRLGGLTLYVTREQAAEASRKFRLPAQRTGYCQVGVDAEFFAPADVAADAPIAPDVRAAATSPYVVVAGDQQRDEALAAKAVQGTGLRLVRLTQEPGTQRFWERHVAAGPAGPPVFCRAGLTIAEVRYLYRRAVCVLNLVDNSWQPAGLTVAKEAMACGTPLVMSSGITTRELLGFRRSFREEPFLELESLDDADRASAAVLKLARDRSYATEVGRAGRRLIEESLDLRDRGRAPLDLLKRHVDSMRRR